MTEFDPAMRKASIFLVRFLLAASGLYIAWEFLGQLYLSSLVLVFNAWSGPAANYAIHREALAIVYTGFEPDPLILVFEDNDIFFMNLLVVVGLILSIGGVLSMGHRLGWITVAVGLVWLTHILSLVAGEYLAIWDFTDSLPNAEQARLYDAVQMHFPRDEERVLRAVFERWRLWMRPTLGLVLWFYVARDYLGLGRDAPLGANP